MLNDIALVQAVIDNLGMGTSEYKLAWKRIKKKLLESCQQSGEAPLQQLKAAHAAIEGALRIKDLWLPDETWGKEHESEAVALNKMYRTFLEVTQNCS